MNSDLKERYVYAVTRRVPRKIKADLEMELNGLIDDMLETRTGGGQATEEDLKAVLEELGPPAKLAENYNGNAVASLIGPAYFPTYKQVLAIVLAAVAIGLAVSGVLGLLAQPRGGAGALPTVASFFVWLAQQIGVLFSALGFVTVLFAFFQWGKIPVTYGGNKLEDLPPVPKEKEKISVGGAIVSMGASVIFAVVLIAVPQALGFYWAEGEELIPMLNVAHLQSMWFVIALLCTVSVVYEAFSLVEGRYSFKLAVANLVANILQGGLFAVFLFAGPIVNPAFVAGLQTVLEVDTPIISTLVGNMPVVLMAIVLFALVLDSILAFWKASRFAQ